MERFQQAVRILRGTGPGNTWEALRDLYITHVMEAHSLPFFLLWHRIYITEVEKKLQVKISGRKLLIYVSQG